MSEARFFLGGFWDGPRAAICPSLDVVDTLSARWQVQLIQRASTPFVAEKLIRFPGG